MVEKEKVLVAPFANKYITWVPEYRNLHGPRLLRKFCQRVQNGLHSFIVAVTAILWWGGRRGGEGGAWCC